VESVDRHSAEVAKFASAFTFLPRWRMDDVMVSLSPNHGTVDAHIDSYDVFLVQGQGRRRWEVDRGATPDYKPGLDLRILKRFKAEDGWVLEPGDMLYVPPGVGHRGITVKSDADIALTYSVGFRAPSTADLLSALLSRTLRQEPPTLFSDSGRTVVKDPGELSPIDLSRLKEFLLRQIGAPGDEAWPLAAGEAVTSGGTGRAPAARVTLKAVARRLAGGATVAPIPGARLTWTGLGRGRAALFVNGESRVLPRGQAFAAPCLCGSGSASSSRRLAADAELVLLTSDLIRAGVISLSD
jgi:50S ribosomal protein L16 3-hydroxylase